MTGFANTVSAHANSADSGFLSNGIGRLKRTRLLEGVAVGETAQLRHRKRHGRSLHCLCRRMEELLFSLG
eukprot:6191087-Pleurochrysis_carterae.AAC.1